MDRFAITDHGEDDKEPFECELTDPCGLSEVLHLRSVLLPKVKGDSPSGIDVRTLWSGSNRRERAVASLRKRAGTAVALTLVTETFPGVPQPEDDVVVVVPPEDTLSVSEALSMGGFIGFSSELAKSTACPACLGALSTIKSLEFVLMLGELSLFNPLLIRRGESGLLALLSDLVFR